MDFDILVEGGVARLKTGDVALIADVARGTFSVSASGRVIIPDGISEAVLVGGEMLSSLDSAHSRAWPQDDTLCIERTMAGGRSLMQRFRPAPIAGGLLVDISLRAGADDAFVERLRPLVVETSKGTPSALEPGSGLWMWRFGTVSPGDPVLFLQLDSPDVPQTHDRFRWLIEDERRIGFSAEMLAVFRSEGSGETCLLGYATVCDQAAGFLITRPRDAFENVRIESRCDVEGIRLLPGEEIHSETLLILPTDDPWRAVKEYAGMLRERYVGDLPAKQLAGWSDWQYYRREVREEDVTLNLETLAAERYPIEYVLVDDGYQSNMSDWLTNNEKFPRGIQWLAEQIRAKGFVPGVWIAPLTAHESSTIARENSDWLVRSRDGDILTHNTHMGKVHAIDYTVEAAQAWLRSLLRTLVRDCGFGWIKLDGPIRWYYSNAAFGVPMTSVQHIRLTMQIIREETTGAILEGEGYYGPSLGLVDTQRVTQDIQQDWPRLKHTAQVNLLSTFMHRAWWINNPDAFILRDHPSDRFEFDGQPEGVMNDEELQTEITALALSGGVVMLTDETKRLTDERKRLIDAFLPVYQSASRPVDLFNGKTCPEIFHQKVKTDCETYDVVAVFNWEDSPRRIPVDLSRIDLESADCRVACEYWTQSVFEDVTDSLDMGEIPPHGVRISAIRPMGKHPFVMGTDLHLTQGGVELKDISWNEECTKLLFAASSWMRRLAHLRVFVPEGLELMNMGANGAFGKATPVSPRHLLIEYDAGGDVRFDVFFRKTHR